MIFVRVHNGETVLELNDPRKMLEMLLFAGVERFTLSACEAVIDTQYEIDESYVFTPENFARLFRQDTPERIAARYPGVFRDYMRDGKIIDRAGLLSAIRDEFFCFEHADSFRKALSSGNSEESIILPDGGVIYTLVPPYEFYRVTGDPKYID